MSDAHFTITIVIVLLLIASGVAMATKWLPVPYTIALVLVGFIISPLHFLPAVHISPDLILLIFLPALIFEASWSLKLAPLRANLFPILFLAVVGIGLSVLITGSIVHWTAGLTWGPAFALWSHHFSDRPNIGSGAFQKTRSARTPESDNGR